LPPCGLRGTGRRVKDRIMASNFRISVHRNSNNLHLKLYGDFDGTSACELIDAVRQKGSRAKKIFVHTEGLKEVFPFGCGVFQRQLPSSKGTRVTFVFTGKDAHELAPALHDQIMVV
jgi:hypothetical protein